VAALLNNRTIEEAAREAGISARTLLRWMKKPDFRESWHEARRDSVSQATSRLQQASGVAVNTLLKGMVDPTVTISRIRAAQSVLALSHKGLELEDFDLRIARLEQREGSESEGQTRGA
jgi:transposase-like protein